MRLLARFLIFLLVVLGVLFGIEQYAAESGEVVVLMAPDAAGTPRETRLWIVEHESQLWLRAGYAGSDWLQRLTAAQWQTNTAGPIAISGNFRWPR